MTTEQFFKKIRTYTDLSNEAENRWHDLLRERTYHKGDHFVRIGQVLDEPDCGRGGLPSSVWALAKDL